MMCPVCISTLAMVAAGATSTGGLAAIVVRMRGRGTGLAASVPRHATSSPESEENDHA